MAWHSGRLLGFDLETTGIDTRRDLPVQVALVWADPDEVRTERWLVDPGRTIPEEAIAIHGITTEQVCSEGCSLGAAAVRIHNAFRRAARSGVPVVAMNASFDITIAEGLFSAFGLPALAWHTLLDPLVMDRRVDPDREGSRRLDALCEHYGVPLYHAHDAGSDAGAAVALARCIGLRYRECGALTPEELTVFQAVWHAEWATAYDTACRQQGLPGLDAHEFSWPCRRPPGLVSPMSPELALARSHHPSLARRLGSRSVA